MSLKGACISFNISSGSLINQWIKRFKRENSELRDFPSLDMSKNQQTSETSEALELQALKKALAEADLKIRALDTMIDIAEDQLKIDIRKKSGARQSSK